MPSYVRAGIRKCARIRALSDDAIRAAYTVHIKQIVGGSPGNGKPPTILFYRPTPKQSKIGVTNNSYARNASARATVSSTSTACASMTGSWGSGNASLSTLSSVQPNISVSHAQGPAGSSISRNTDS